MQKKIVVFFFFLFCAKIKSGGSAETIPVRPVDHWIRKLAIPCLSTMTFLHTVPFGTPSACSAIGSGLKPWKANPQCTVQGVGTWRKRTCLDRVGQCQIAIHTYWTSTLSVTCVL